MAQTECATDMDESEDASYLVHKQLQDVVKAQREVLMRFNESSHTQAQSDSETSVKQEMYDLLFEELEREKNHHLETQSHLQAERLRREFAEGEVDILKAQMERERKRYEECLERMKAEAQSESAHKSEIESQFSMIAYEKQQKENLVHLNQTKIQDLKKRISKQKQNHRKQIDEVNIRIQQEAYINKMLTGKDRKSKQK
ncbi:spermatogenesis-associated protein 24-like [Apostichopus japonicus]|uniref:spermatogenesis-associated protein 24-like n=1 Tax=Stichopus japonicus TaxID=307972 RepID=UPI003AB72FE1